MTAILSLSRGSRHPGPLALSAAANGGIAGTIFFSIRDVVVGPLLRTALHSSGQIDHMESTSSQPSWSHLRMRGVPDTVISGAFTGAIIKAWQRSGSIWAGARTVAIICTGLQFGYNELSVMRVKIVSRRMRPQPEPDTAPVLPPTQDSSKQQLSWFDRAMSMIGFTKLSDEEYLRILKKQRDGALERIAVLEQERGEREQLHADEEKGA